MASRWTVVVRFGVVARHGKGQQETQRPAATNALRETRTRWTLELPPVKYTSQIHQSTSQIKTAVHQRGSGRVTPRSPMVASTAQPTRSSRTFSTMYLRHQREGRWCGMMGVDRTPARGGASCLWNRSTASDDGRCVVWLVGCVWDGSTAPPREGTGARERPHSKCRRRQQAAAVLSGDDARARVPRSRKRANEEARVTADGSLRMSR